MPERILIIGASGSGTSTLGKMLADKLNIPHIDTDELFWFPVYPPFTKFRSPDELKIILNGKVISQSAWVLTGSPCGWGDAVIPLVNLAVFLLVPTEIRIERIVKREQERLGSEIGEGGGLFDAHQHFLAWTKCYDAGGVKGRTRELHEQWLLNLSCPILRFEGDINPANIVESILYTMS